MPEILSLEMIVILNNSGTVVLNLRADYTQQLNHCVSNRSVRQFAIDYHQQFFKGKLSLIIFLWCFTGLILLVIFGH